MIYDMQNYSKIFYRCYKQVENVQLHLLKTLIAMHVSISIYLFGNLFTLSTTYFAFISTLK
jgi:hypothetical protein